MDFEWDPEKEQSNQRKHGVSFLDDFSGGVRGKHHKAYREGTNVVLLEPEVARVFRDSAAVNRALRMLIDLATKKYREPDQRLQWPLLTSRR